MQSQGRTRSLIPRCQSIPSSNGSLHRWIKTAATYYTPLTCSYKKRILSPGRKSRFRRVAYRDARHPSLVGRNGKKSLTVKGSSKTEDWGENAHSAQDRRAVHPRDEAHAPGIGRGHCYGRRHSASAWTWWIGNSTLILLSKFAIGESFHLMLGRTTLWSVTGPPCGQRCVTTFVRVKNRMLSSQYWLRSPKAESFQPPWQ